MDKSLVKFSLLFLIGYFVFSLAYSQYLFVLNDLNYTGFERSLILSIMSLFSMITQFIFGKITDKHNNLKSFMIYSIIIFCIFFTIFYYFNYQIFIIHFLSFVFGAGFYFIIINLADNWVFQYSDDTRRQYSFIRMFGSLGWAVGSILLPVIIAGTNYKNLSIAIPIGSIIVLFLILSIKEIKLPVVHKVQQKHDFKSLFTKKYTIVLIIGFCLYSLNYFNMIMVTDKMYYLDATSNELGLTWLIKAGLEIPILLLGNYLLRKFSDLLLLFISAVAMTLQFVLFYLAKDVNTILWISAMQIFTFPLLLISIKNIVYDNTKKELLNSGQLFATSIFNGLTALILPYYISISVSLVGLNDSILYASAFGVIAIVFIIIYKKLKEKTND